MYVLVLMRRGRNADDDQLHSAAHERFIDSLIGRNAVLLGGPFAEPVDEVIAAYVLRCGGVDEARRIAGEDPLVARDVVRVDCVGRELVGIDTDAIEADTVVEPDGPS